MHPRSLSARFGACVDRPIHYTLYCKVRGVNLSSFAAKTGQSRLQLKEACSWALWALVLAAGWLNLHLLFGLLLLSFVLAEYRRRGQGPAFADSNTVRDFSRRVGRKIYLLLFLIAGAKQFVRCVSGIAAKPPDDLDIMLAYGIAAIAITRVLAVWVARSCADGVACGKLGGVEPDAGVDL